MSVARYFADLPDPRVDRTKKHSLTGILVIALCAVVCGADSWEEVEAFGEAKADWLMRFLALPNGIASHDTFYRAFAQLDPRAFREFAGGWIWGGGRGGRAAAHRHRREGGPVGPGNTFSGCLHLVSAGMAAENRLILGQQAVADGSHEIAAIPALLKVLELKGALVTLDAAGCQKQIARQVREQGGDYLLAVKGNQPTLPGAVRAVFGRASEADFAGVEHDGHEDVEDGHARHSTTTLTERSGSTPPRHSAIPGGQPDSKRFCGR